MSTVEAVLALIGGCTVLILVCLGLVCLADETRRRYDRWHDLRHPDRPSHVRGATDHELARILQEDSR